MCVMNISLTWADYALITGTCLIGYYLVIGVVYYRKDLLRILQSKKEPVSYARNQQPASTVENSYPSSLLSNTSGLDNVGIVDDELPDAHPNVQDFVDEIQAYTQACGEAVSREALLIHLRSILHKYPSLINSSLRSVLAGIIATASENNCSIPVREEELNEWWND